MSRPIALATCANLPDLYADDQRLLAALRVEGLAAVPVVWDCAVDWSAYAAVVVRSTWDYWEKHDAFLKWADSVERAGGRLFNPASVLRENTRKTYLKRLERAGVPVMATRWFERGYAGSLATTVAETDWPEFVLKPAVSGGAFRTYRFLREDVTQFESAFRTIVNDCEALLQPLAPEVLREGEYSFLFFNGEFSHAVLKSGAQGEFRIQRTYGGTSSPHAPRAEEIQAAREMIAAAYDPRDLLYARVDVIRDSKDPRALRLMELELTEPNLFFTYDGARPGAAERFARALRSRL